jgi:hypothetical protein
MFRSKKYYINAEKGIALIAALLACLILMALGTLVITLSTGDIRTSSQLVGEKRAVTAAEKGIVRLTQNFNPDPDHLAANANTTLPDDLAADSHSKYQIGTPSVPAAGPTVIPMAGYSLAGGQTAGLTIFNANVTGQNTLYNTRVTIGVGVGYGPVEMTTMSR